MGSAIKSGVGKHTGYIADTGFPDAASRAKRCTNNDPNPPERAPIQAVYALRTRSSSVSRSEVLEDAEDEDSVRGARVLQWPQ